MQVIESSSAEAYATVSQANGIDHSGFEKPSTLEDRDVFKADFEIHADRGANCVDWD